MKMHLQKFKRRYLFVQKRNNTFWSMENTDYLMNTPNISHPVLKILVEQEPYRFLDEKGTPEIKHITEKLELELGESLKGRSVSISDIKGVKSRFVLLIGSDDNLLEAVGAYIYCLNCIKVGTSLFYHSFRGGSDDCLAKVLNTNDTFFNNTTIVQREFVKEGGNEGFGTKNVSSTGYPKIMDGDLIDHIKQGRSVFLSDLKYPNSLLLEITGKRIKGIVTHRETYEVDKRGLLITSAESEKDLPEYFVKQFKKIDLEAEKRSIPQERMKSDIYNWSINSDKSEIYSNGKFVIRLPGIQFKIFKCLHEKKDKFVKRNTLEKCWDKEPSYENYLVDTMNELETKLKNGLKKLEGINVQGKIIESKNNNKRKFIAYKLPT